MQVAPSKGRARSNSAFQRSFSSPFPEEAHDTLCQDSITLLKNTEVSPHRQGLPAWDRTLDAVYHRHAEGQSTVNKDAQFKDALGQFFKDHDHERPSSRYFRLPDSIRLRISQLVLAPHRTEKPIRLNRSSFNRDCWRNDDLQSSSTALLPLGPYLQVSFGFRADLLVAFLLDVRLHATFSPYVGPRVSPLATTWLNRYGRYAQNIVIEIDMTRLGCGPGTDAVSLLPGVDHVDALLQKFVKSQLDRDKSRPLDSLSLLCRRFYGQRYHTQPTRSVTGRSSEASNYSRLSQRSEPPSGIEGTRQDSPGFEKALSSSPVRRRYFWNIESEEAADFSAEGNDGVDTPDLKQTDSKILTSPLMLSHQAYYCPDSYLGVCNCLLELSDHVNSLRICGFSESFTTCFVNAMFPFASTKLEQHCYRVAPSTMWPRLSGQKSYIDTGNGSLSLDDHEAVPVANSSAELAAWEGCVQLPPPILDTRGTPYLPPVVSALQRMRSQPSDSSMDNCIQDLVQENEVLEEVGTDKTRMMRLLDVYGKAKAKRKRSLTKEISATL
ncbi:hypothetical protein G7Z17_g3265 [Cylindrodendrum hubeiense]|uniref:Uncharacterized protein n=1 Tax=Cylindrodendrum hubeiense TaxID=595255 RepID=A0A9P5HB67_9HYPO|nr:hypothetical protein G7Z17_g3265 [Cylindrodendrum hubeiense]